MPTLAFPQGALHERKWLAWLGLSVFLFQNPVMIVGNFVAPDSRAWGLASELSLSLGIAMFFVVALCIADGIGRDKAAKKGKGGAKSFYLPKVRFVFSLHGASEGVFSSHLFEFLSTR